MDSITKYGFRQVFGRMFELRMVYIDITKDRISIIEKLLLLQCFGNAHTVSVDHKKMGKCIPVDVFRFMCFIV